ncbi:DUF4382 domain-containing protein [Aliifodinibius salicampi]|uniref:DUF4382 domain-containing protein n=1 Tax=Fodinibius salicampi TaxID=1920655 RepID=A0ABT3PVW0_9BACT|nr:DUF4382 domain-containing protein [Fodinibius salicampi]MCW9711995.1 DUF4382 domain-containing protein [Fodinibius salicampi]
MLQNKILSLPLVLFFAVAVFFTACDNSGTGSDGSMGTMTVEMTDAPIDSADAVNVFIERVEVNNAENEEEGWIVLNEPQQSYNLLELTNGATEVIGTKELEPGTYNQIRLILSEGGHSVEVGGEVHDMKVPSGPQTGIKLNIDAEIEPDIEYVLLLDFDASRSVVAAGPPGDAVKYLLKPVIKAKEKAITGNIEGVVDPAEAQPVVYAIDDVDATEPDTLASTIADTTSGDFKIIGLEEGSYDVSIDPRNDDYQSETVEDVSVTIGQSNDLGTVELNQQ